MSSAYHSFAPICLKFYQLTVPSAVAASLVIETTEAAAGQRCLFDGSMTTIARELIARGLRLTVVDYSEEMVSLLHDELSGTDTIVADLRALPFSKQFDLVAVVGRVFTHLVSDADMHNGIRSVKAALKPGGRLFADNYEDTVILQTKYFNSVIECSDSETTITRTSQASLLSKEPFVVEWSARYEGVFNGTPFSFADSLPHRAFKREEFAAALHNGGLRVLRQGRNFDETSFFTVAERDPSEHAPA